MKKLFLTLLLLPTVFSLLSAQPAKVEKKDYRAVWLTTLMGLDWPKTRANSAEGITRQKQELIDILDRLQQAGINTVLFQTRLRGTTAYPSDIEPWDGAFTGTPGKSPNYDPLRFALDEAHKRGMELHAWVVAFPVNKVADMKRLGNRSLPRRHPELCQLSNDQYLMDPGVPATGDYIASICQEIAQNYEVDGIHLDYIRYPENGIRFSDAQTYKRYGQGQPINRWRTENVTRVVRKIRRAVDSVRPGIVLSCSPVGKYADMARQSSRGWNARDAVHQDAVAWLNEGTMDVLFPMMYFDGDNFYPFVLDWKERAQRGAIVPGLGLYCLSANEKDWPLVALQRQINFLRTQHLNGFCLFRSKFLTDNVKGVFDWLSHSYDNNPLQAMGGIFETLRQQKKSTALSPSADWQKVPRLNVDAETFVVVDNTGREIRRFRPDSVFNTADLPHGFYQLRALGRKKANHKIMDFRK